MMLNIWHGIVGDGKTNDWLGAANGVVTVSTFQVVLQGQAPLHCRRCHRCIVTTAPRGSARLGTAEVTRCSVLVPVPTVPPRLDVPPVEVPTAAARLQNYSRLLEGSCHCFRNRVPKRQRN